ncbi:MAG: DUF177 domain-containing protein [Candidatus Zixiibacteriota bacterium]|nr:MAG: DUF177 domain-containing protein [candidate division Zixibacteria bacterium]
MILNLKEFDSFPARKVLRGDQKDLDLEFDSIRSLNRIEFSLEIQKSGEEYFCQGEARASVQMTCARCLGEFDQDLVNSTDFIVCTREQALANRDVVDNEDYAYFQGQDLQADVSHIVRQTLITAVSMKPLCSEDCRGLCPQCGTNLNENSCKCRKTNIDQRWEGLKKLSG